MIETLARISFHDFLTNGVVELATKIAREARASALGAGQMVTTYKDGRLVREQMQGGKIIELFSEDRERASRSGDTFTFDDV